MNDLPIRILHCPIGEMNVGGISSVIMQIYRNIDRHRFQFDFVIHSDSKNYFEDEIVSMGGRIFRVPFISRNPLKHCDELRSVLLMHPEDKIVHIHTTYAITVFDAGIAHRCGRIVIIHSHNSGATGAHTVFHKLFMPVQASLADYRLSCSYISGKWMFGNRDFDIWKNAISLEKFKYDKDIRNRIRDELGFSDDDFVFGTVCRLSFQKNVGFMIDAFCEYAKIYTHSKMVIVGGGDEENLLHQKVRMLNAEDKILFTGMKSRVHEYLFAFDAFLLTSRWEGLGIAMVEAQATGLPVLAAPVTDRTVGILDSFSNVNDMSQDSWVRAMSNIRRVSDENRIKAYSIVKKSGFDVTTQILTAEEFYKRVYK